MDAVGWTGTPWLPCMSSAQCALLEAGALLHICNQLHCKLTLLWGL